MNEIKICLQKCLQLHVYNNMVHVDRKKHYLFGGFFFCKNESILSLAVANFYMDWYLVKKIIHILQFGNLLATIS